MDLDGEGEGKVENGSRVGLNRDAVERECIIKNFTPCVKNILSMRLGQVTRLVSYKPSDH